MMSSFHYQDSMDVVLKKACEGKPSCERCGKRFHSKSNLITHIKFCDGQKVFPQADCSDKPMCSICGLVFIAEYDLMLHKESHDRHSDSFECLVCGDRFVTKAELRTHKKRHTSTSTVKCNMCGVSLSSSAAATKHMIDKHGVKVLNCILCPSFHKSAFDLVCHLKQEHKIKSEHLDKMLDIDSKKPCKEFGCCLCQQQFDDYSTLQKHIENHDRVQSKTKKVDLSKPVSGVWKRHLEKVKQLYMQNSDEEGRISRIKVTSTSKKTSVLAQQEKTNQQSDASQAAVSPTTGIVPTPAEESVKQLQEDSGGNEAGETLPSSCALRQQEPVPVEFVTEQRSIEGLGRNVAAEGQQSSPDSSACSQIIPTMQETPAPNIAPPKRADEKLLPEALLKNTKETRSSQHQLINIKIYDQSKMWKQLCKQLQGAKPAAKVGNKTGDLRAVMRREKFINKHKDLLEQELVEGLAPTEMLSQSADGDSVPTDVEIEVTIGE